MGEPALAEPPAVAPAPKARPGEIPILTKLKARNLYLHQGLPYKAIAEATGIKQATLEVMAHREGWTAIRRKNKESLVKAQDARINASQSDVVNAIAEISEQHSIRALEKTGEALERGDRDAARDAQAYSATARNLVGIARDCRAPAGSDAKEGSVLNVFILRTGDIQAEAKAEPKQVQEVEAKSVSTSPNP